MAWLMAVKFPAGKDGRVAPAQVNEGRYPARPAVRSHLPSLRTSLAARRPVRILDSALDSAAGRRRRFSLLSADLPAPRVVIK